MAQTTGRVFLFLQGPHGPFFRHLAQALVRRGARVRRVVFNAADLAEWGDAGPVDLWEGQLDGYRDFLECLVRRCGITDVVVYGEARPIHAEALTLAETLGLGTHRLEEGYLRPYWVTYEKQGTNGASPALGIPLATMKHVVGIKGQRTDEGPPPTNWGATRQHLGWSALYHARLLIPTRRFAGYSGHRAEPLHREIGFYLRRMASSIPRVLGRAWARRRLRRSADPYHLVLMQLSFDCAMAAHGPYSSNVQLAEALIGAFEYGAPPDHHLVFRTHPFEDGRERLARRIRHLARARGLRGRVHLIDGGGGLGPLLDSAQSAVTINSTAGQQALARRVPLLALGQAIYSRPGLVAEGDAAAFFADPVAPDPLHYDVFRRYLLATSQFEGSFYSAAGIARLLDTLPETMLAAADPYEVAARKAEPVEGSAVIIPPRTPLHRPSEAMAHCL